MIMVVLIVSSMIVVTHWAILFRSRFRRSQFQRFCPASIVDTGHNLVYMAIMRLRSAIFFGFGLMGVAIYCFHTAVAVAYVATGVIRARDLGIPFDGGPGELNAITDVPAVEVGHVTLIQGAGKLIVGQGPVRTGVTAILPLGKDKTNT